MKEPRFLRVGIVVGGLVLAQSSFAQSGLAIDRTAGQAIAIKQEPGAFDSDSRATVAAKPAQTRGAIGTRRSRHRAFLVPRRK